MDAAADPQSAENTIKLPGDPKAEGIARFFPKAAVIMNASEGPRMVTLAVLFTGFFVAPLLRMTEVLKRLSYTALFRYLRRVLPCSRRFLRLLVMSNMIRSHQKYAVILNREAVKDPVNRRESVTIGDSSSLRLSG